jgi:hypothetical protein
MILSKPPAVFVVTNEWFDRPSTFDKIGNWPRFAAYLKVNYRLNIERNFTGNADTGYHIHVLRDTVKILKRGFMMEAITKLKQINGILVGRNVYWLLMIAAVMWLLVHYNVRGLPLTDDDGYSLRSPRPKLGTISEVCK